MRRKASLKSNTRALSTFTDIGSSPNTVCSRDIVLHLPSRDMPESNGDDESRRVPVLYLREWIIIASAFLVWLGCCLRLKFYLIWQIRRTDSQKLVSIEVHKMWGYALRGQNLPDREFLFLCCTHLYEFSAHFILRLKSLKKHCRPMIARRLQLKLYKARVPRVARLLLILT